MKGPFLALLDVAKILVPFFWIARVIAVLLWTEVVPNKSYSISDFLITIIFIWGSYTLGIFAILDYQGFEWAVLWSHGKSWLGDAGYSWALIIIYAMCGYIGDRAFRHISAKYDDFPL